MFSQSKLGVSGGQITEKRDRRITLSELRITSLMCDSRCSSQLPRVDIAHAKSGSRVGRARIRAALDSGLQAEPMVPGRDDSHRVGETLTLRLRQ